MENCDEAFRMLGALERERRITRDLWKRNELLEEINNLACLIIEQLGT